MRSEAGLAQHALDGGRELGAELARLREDRLPHARSAGEVGLDQRHAAVRTGRLDAEDDHRFLPGLDHLSVAERPSPQRTAGWLAGAAERAGLAVVPDAGRAVRGLD
jgi:hypothetical protein